MLNLRWAAKTPSIIDGALLERSGLPTNCVQKSIFTFKNASWQKNDVGKLAEIIYSIVIVAHHT